MPIYKILFLCSFLCFSSCSPKKEIQSSQSIKENAPKHLEKPYVILISIDGFRHDYLKRFQPPNLSKFVANGVQAESLIPCFPSKTFPNHYSIATGMYPENHNIINNSFFDPAKKELYQIRDRDKVENGDWYGGTPLWVNASKAGMVSASYFFVGSEADIQKVRPSYYYQYDKSVPNEERTKQAIDWLKLPKEKRPHLITMYFSDIDDTGHRYGPNNDEQLSKALLQLDQTLGTFFEQLKALQLDINIIFVSDHGMVEIPKGNLLHIEQVEDDDKYTTVNGGTTVHIYPKAGQDIDDIYNSLKQKEKHFKVYKTKGSPFYIHNQDNPKLGELLVLSDFQYFFADARRIAFVNKLNSVSGQHGFSPSYPELHGIFYANGPAFNKEQIIPSFENIHIYPLICNILGLDIPNEVDGELNVLQQTLK